MPFVQYATQASIAYITLNRPEKSNALNKQLIYELSQAFHKAENDQKIKVVVLKALGKTFCAGIDLVEMQQFQNRSWDENLQDAQNLAALFYQIYTLRTVVIAQIQGYALGGGCGLATVCDFSFTVPTAKLGYQETKIGFVPAIVAPFLMRKIGQEKTKTWLLTGDLQTASHAMHDGLIHYIVSPDVLQKKVNDFSKKLIQQHSADALVLTKRIILGKANGTLKKELEASVLINTKARFTKDCKAGVAAFLNKEIPCWHK